MKNINHIPFSVCMSVYKNDNADHFLTAIRSVTIQQTIRPNEVVLVIDGPISEALHQTIVSFTAEFSDLNVICFKQNQGLGNALKIGVESAKYDIIARMDSDDIAVPNRFEKQLTFMMAHPDTVLVGGQIDEFINQPEEVVGKRIVPCQNEEIYEYMKRRCPFNHMTVMFRRQAVVEAGNYIEWHYNEDYYLWIRMALKGMQFANLQTTLVNVRVGDQMYNRRGGYSYYKSEKDIQKFMYKFHFINLWEYMSNIVVRFIVQILLPNNIRGKIFQLFFRK